MTREEAIEVIENIPSLSYKMGEEQSVHLLANALYTAIEALKEPKRVHGHWDKKALRPTCSFCGFCGSILDAPVAPFKYCPNCGAIMDEGDNDGMDKR